MCAVNQQSKPESRFAWSDRDAAVDAQTVFTALEDDTCRTILEAATDDPLTATELSERCDIPQSTTYRKLELLTEAGLLDETLRLRKDGRHASQYLASFDDVTVSIHDASGVEVSISSKAAAQASD